MKIALLNDTHIGARNNSETIIKQQKDFFENVFFPYCKKHNIKTIVHLGDLFDNRKHVNFKSLKHFKDFFIRPLIDNGMTMHIIPGNHCLAYRQSFEVCSLIELLDQYPKQNIQIYMNPVELNFDGFLLALMPWINQTNYKESIDFLKKTKAEWLGGHFELNGFEVMKGVRMHEGMESKILKKFEQVLSGHFHIASKKDNIWYLGTQYQLTWADCGETKYFHVLDTSDRSVTPVKNPNNLFEKIFYNDRLDRKKALVDCVGKYIKLYVVNKPDVNEFETFVSSLNSSGAIDVKIIENTYIEDNTLDEELEKSDLSDTPTLIEKYLESLETEHNKKYIKQKMFELLTEAQALESI